LGIQTQLSSAVNRVRQSLNRRYRNSRCPDLDLSKAEAEARVFCFAGEFGYEIISWLPYLHYLKRELGVRLRTCGRPGSSVLYPFSDEHLEFGPGKTGQMWGEFETYEEIRAELSLPELIHPRKRRRIVVAGAQWLVTGIHERIPEENYVRLDYGSVRDPLPFDLERPVIVINNKFYTQWGMDRPVNSFYRDDLIELRDYLLGRGYAVVYNHFRELTRSEKQLVHRDHDLFGTVPHTVDLNDHYGTADALERNRAQISLYNRAELVIAPQGGSVYLPAVARRPLLILMRKGEYLDYTELGRIYEVEVDVFYEVRHMLAWLSRHD
jgi:hypothetical protein